MVSRFTAKLKKLKDYLVKFSSPPPSPPPLPPPPPPFVYTYLIFLSLVGNLMLSCLKCHDCAFAMVSNKTKDGPDPGIRHEGEENREAWVWTQSFSCVL